jgi:hypothetical protein
MEARTFIFARTSSSSEREGRSDTKERRTVPVEYSRADADVVCMASCFRKTRESRGYFRFGSNDSTPYSMISLRWGAFTIASCCVARGISIPACTRLKPAANARAP